MWKDPVIIVAAITVGGSIFAAVIAAIVNHFKNSSDSKLATIQLEIETLTKGYNRLNAEAEKLRAEVQRLSAELKASEKFGQHSTAKYFTSLSVIGSIKASYEQFRVAYSADGIVKTPLPSFPTLPEMIRFDFEQSHPEFAIATAEPNNGS